MNDSTIENLRTCISAIKAMRSPVLDLAAAIDAVNDETIDALVKSGMKTELRQMILDIRGHADVVSMLVENIVRRELATIMRKAAD